MSLNQFLCLCGAGACAAGGQFTITAAYYHAPAREISIYDYSNIVFAGILGFVFLDQVPDIFSVAGYFIIIGTAILVFIYNSKNAAKRQSEN